MARIATTGDVEVTNPELVICHLGESATFNMELTTDVGRLCSGRRLPEVTPDELV